EANRQGAHTAEACQLGRASSANAPREALRIESKGGRVALRERRFLVAEDGRGEQVEQDVLLAAAHGVMETSRRLEDDPRLAARADEAREVCDRRHDCAPAAHLRPKTEGGQLADARRDVVVE